MDKNRFYRKTVAVLIIGLILGAVVPGSVGIAAALSNSGGGDWKYQKAITIKENSGKTLTDYQVLVELKGNDFPIEAKPDGTDIRFTNAKGKELSYWIENWDYSGKSAKIWVKVPRIPANGETKITMRYGNPGASPQSNGDATFDIFEDFDVDDGEWTEYDPNDKIELDYTTDHRLEFSNWIRTDPGYVYKSYSSRNFVEEYDIDITNYGGNANIIGPGFSDTLGTLDKKIKNGVYSVYYAGFGGPQIDITTYENGNKVLSWGSSDRTNRIDISSNIIYYVRLEKFVNTVKLSIFSDDGRTKHIAQSPKILTTDLSDSSFNYYYLVVGCTHLPPNWEWTTGWMDNFKVRKYASPEPTITVRAEQLYPDLTLSSSDISLSDPHPLEGETVTITAEIHNIGNADANNVFVQFFDGYPEKIGSEYVGKLTGSKRIDSIPAGESKTAQVEWTPVSGVHDIYVFVDPDNSISESNEENNAAVKDNVEVALFKTDFDPVVHGFHFKNWGYCIPVDSFCISHCLGMSYAALDYYHNGIPIPPDKESPPSDIVARLLIDAYQYGMLSSAILENAINILQIYATDESTLLKLHYGILCEHLAEKEPTVILLAPAGTGSGHAVVVYKIVENENEKRIYVYDSNYPDTPRCIHLVDTNGVFDMGIYDGYLRFAVMGTFSQIPSLNIATTISDIIKPNEKISRSIPIDQSVKIATFDLNWQGSDIDLTLLTPDGTVIDPLVAASDPNVTYFESATCEYYTIKNPAPGNWAMNITAVNVPPDGEAYTAAVYLTTNLTLSLIMDKYQYEPNEPIGIKAKLMDEGITVVGASVRAEIQHQKGLDNITLFDDGTHGDLHANDGVYSNTYTTGVEGTCSIRASASGKVRGYPFIREMSRAISISTAKTGSIYVSSDPYGAKVYLDGVYKGTAPLTISNVPIGSYTVKLSKFGYEGYSKAVVVYEGETSNVHASLPLASWILPFIFGVIVVVFLIIGIFAIKRREVIRRERYERKRREYREKLEQWQSEGYDVSELKRKEVQMTNLSRMEKDFRDYERRIQRLKQLERELNSLNTEGLEAEANAIKSKLKDPKKVEEIEKNIITLKTEIEERETKYKEALDAISSAKTSIEEAKEFGCDLSEADNLLNKADSSFNIGNHADAIRYARQSEETAKRIRGESKPEISVDLSEKVFRPKVWKRIDLIVLNKGNAHAKDIKVDFSKEVEIKELQTINLKPNEEKHLKIGLMPIQAGEVPLEVKINYKDLDEREYKEKVTFWITAGEEVKGYEIPSVKEGRALIIERAIYDPCKRDFIAGALPRMKEWINRYDPSAYWFAISIQNNTDKEINNWGVELETSSALKIQDAKIEGIEIEIPHEAHLNSFKISVPKEYGIVIPKGGTQRVYFKLRADKPKTMYVISGVFKSEITGDVPIRAKEFKYLCDAGVSPEAVKAELKKAFSEKDAARLANTFRIVQEIRSSYCNTNTTAKGINKEFDLLKMYFTEKEFLNEIGGIQRRINAELREDERLSEKHVEEVNDFCEKFTEMWIAKFLR